jgi:hypothetical protein
MSEEIQEKENHITDYITSMASIEASMEPYKEQKRALKGNYVENGWLSKEEISMAVRAYRMVKGDIDIEQLIDFYDHVSKTVR